MRKIFFGYGRRFKRLPYLAPLPAPVVIVKEEVWDDAQLWNDSLTWNG